MTKSKRFTTLELVTALVAAAIMGTVFVQGVMSLRQAHLAHVRKSRASLVLNNTIERLAAQPAPTVAQAERVLREEFAGGELPRAESLRPEVTILDSRKCRLAVVHENGRPVMKVEAPLWSAEPSR